MKEPLVMLTNDDGWDSPGLISSWMAVKDLARTLVLAPASQMSGVGKAITLDRPLKLTPFTHDEMDDYHGYMLDGTPADCVNIGLYKVAESKPDLLISGINLGPNLGLDDLTSSGTMGACLQAAMYGIPSICISYCLEDYAKNPTIVELGLSQTIVSSTANWILENGMPRGVDILIIAVPETSEEVRPMARETRLAISPLPDIYDEISEGIFSFKSRTLDLYEGEGNNDDVSILLGNQISMTPFSLKQLVTKTDILKPIIGEINKDRAE
jgi:5'-nucleotidase